MNGYITLTLTAFIPTLLTVVFIYLDLHSKFKNLPYIVKQIIYGILFGVAAIIGTEFGAPINGAQMNARDAAVLTAGLLFGGPAGMIAGAIGGVERYIAVNWGIGTFTQVACSVSTIIAGLYSAVLRKYMFNDKQPGWFIAFAIGFVMEVFHMTMVFVTNMDNTSKAMQVVKVCSITMISANSLSVALSVFVASILLKVEKENKDRLSISKIIQRWLLICVAFAFVLTTLFTFKLQNTIAQDTAKQYLSIAIKDVSKSIKNTSDNNLLSITKKVKKDLEEGELLESLPSKYDLAEVSIINSEGIIVESTEPTFVGYDMTSGEQSKAFMTLVNTNSTLVQKYGPIAMDSAVYRKFAGISYEDGFIQVGYNREQFYDDLSSQVAVATHYRHVGNTGYLLIANSTGVIVSSPNSVYGKLESHGINISGEENTVFETEVDGVNCYCMYATSEGYNIVSIITKDECLSTRDTALYSNSFMEVLVFALMFASIYMLIKNTVINKIDRVNNSLDKITDGDLNEKVNVTESSEFALLSKDINETVDALKDYIKQANERIDAEIEYAKNIQNSALPHLFPESNRMELFALMEPAKGVGGDFYDFFKTKHNTVNFMIADVSGKGIPGAMFMMRSKTQLHSLTDTGIDVDQVFTMGNNSLCENNDAGMFVTAWQGAINLKTGLVQYANAGHNPPVIMRADGTCEFVKGKVGLVLAAMEDFQYKLQELQMNPGDILFLYTDGVVEATNEDKQLFGDNRLIECLSKIDRNMSMDYVCCEVIGEVGRFVGNAEQFDDITMMAFKYIGPDE